MPRLTNSDYYKRYRLLCYIVSEYTAIFPRTLNETERFAIYNYYQPHFPGLTKQQCLQHRQDITEADPGLPARASKAFLKLTQAYEQKIVKPERKQRKQAQAAQVNRRPSKRRKLVGVTVEAEMRDEIDWDRYAWALLQYARIVAESENPSQ